MLLQGWVNGIFIDESLIYDTLCIVLLNSLKMFLFFSLWFNVPVNNFSGLKMGLYFSEIDTRG